MTNVHHASINYSRQQQWPKTIKNLSISTDWWDLFCITENFLVHAKPIIYFVRTSKCLPKFIIKASKTVFDKVFTSHLIFLHHAYYFTHSSIWFNLITLCLRITLFRITFFHSFCFFFCLAAFIAYFSDAVQLYCPLKLKGCNLVTFLKTMCHKVCNDLISFKQNQDSCWKLKSLSFWTSPC